MFRPLRTGGTSSFIVEALDFRQRPIRLPGLEQGLYPGVVHDAVDAEAKNIGDGTADPGLACTSARHFSPATLACTALKSSLVSPLKASGEAHANRFFPRPKFVGCDGLVVIEDFPNEDRLSELLRTFLFSYCLGMLVRNFSSRRISLLRNEKGDLAQPILVAAMNRIEADYP